MNETTKSTREKVGRFVTILRRGRRYYAEFRVGAVQSRRALGTRNLKGAREQALELDAQLQRGAVPQRYARVPLSEAIDDYLAYAESEGCRPTTLEKYRSALLCFRDYASGQSIAHLDQVSLFVLDRFRAWLRKAGYSEATVEQDTVLVKQLAKWAVGRGLLQTYALAAVKGQKVRVHSSRASRWSRRRPFCLVPVGSCGGFWKCSPSPACGSRSSHG